MKSVFLQKILIAISFGLLGLLSNFHTIIFPFSEYKVAVLFGLLFPLLVTLSWGVRWGVLSALAGGCQSMWWLWGPYNGYATFFIVPPFTLWIVWHGFFADLRRKEKHTKWWLNMYIVEIPFRIFCTINLLTFTRWAITLNPPKWSWARDAVNVVPMHFTVLVIIKQAIVAFVLLLVADVLLNISFVRHFFKLRQSVDYRKTGYIISIFLLIGFCYWILDSLCYSFAFSPEKTFVELFATNIPESNLFTRIVFLLFCLCAGLITATLLRRQRESERALKKSEEELYWILQGSFIATFVINNERTVTHWNKAAEKLTGIPAGEIIGTQNPWEQFSANDFPIPTDFLAATTTDERQIMSRDDEITVKSKLLKDAYQEEDFYPYLGKKGLWLFTSATPLVDKNGTINGAIVTFLDTTDRKQSEEEATISEQLLRTLIRSIPDVVWLKDKEGKYQFCNARFEELLGYSEGEIVGKTDYDFLDEERADSYREDDKRCMEMALPSKHEHKVLFASDGHPEVLETIKTPIYSGEGQLSGILGIGRNISERLDLQAQLVQAQKMETVGRLAGGVAHDFNNMLSIIIGNTEMIIEDLPHEHPILPKINEILIAAGRSSDLTRQLLAFARKQTIAPESLNLNQTVEGMLKMLQRLIGENIDLEWRPGQAIWPVKIDPSQVDQILVNLLVNARDAIIDTGTVTIETYNAEFSEDYCKDHPEFIPGDYVTLAIGDNGCGMDQKTIECLFEPFFTTKQIGHGTGLGLATVYGIIKQNNGFIYVYSEVGVGSIFKIYLQKHEEEITSQPKSQKKKTPLEGNETILLVEDEEAILKTTTMQLQRLGYTVLAATNPVNAIELQEMYSDKEIHLLLTDVVMPEMNGLDLTKEMVKVRPQIKCLYMSGYTANVIAHHGILEKGLHFIGKPFSKHELSCKLREVLDTKEN